MEIQGVNLENLICNHEVIYTSLNCMQFSEGQKNIVPQLKKRQSLSKSEKKMWQRYKRVTEMLPKQQLFLHCIRR